MKLFVLCQYCKQSMITVTNIEIGADLKSVIEGYGWDKTEKGYRCDKCKGAVNGNTVRG